MENDKLNIVANESSEQFMVDRLVDISEQSQQVIDSIKEDDVALLSTQTELFTKEEDHTLHGCGNNWHLVAEGNGLSKSSFDSEYCMGWTTIIVFVGIFLAFSAPIAFAQSQGLENTKLDGQLFIEELTISNRRPTLDGVAATNNATELGPSSRHSNAEIPNVQRAPESITPVEINDRLSPLVTPSENQRLDTRQEISLVGDELVSIRDVIKLMGGGVELADEILGFVEESLFLVGFEVTTIGLVAEFKQECDTDEAKKLIDAARKKTQEAKKKLADADKKEADSKKKLAETEQKEKEIRNKLKAAQQESNKVRTAFRNARDSRRKANAARAQGNEELAKAYDAEAAKYDAQVKAAQGRVMELRAEMNKLVAETKKLLAEGKKLEAEAKALRAKAQQLLAEADELMAKAQQLLAKCLQ